MSRNVIIILILVGLLVAVAASVVGGTFAYLRYRDARTLTRANEAYDAQDWRVAKLNYVRYLMKHPEATELLHNYADASMHVRINRPSAVKDAGEAYLRLARENPDDGAAREFAIDFLRVHGLWNQLEYVTSEYLKSSPEEESLVYHHALAMDRQGRTREAIKAYGQLVAVETERIDVYGSLARLSREENLEQQALDFLDQARERFGDNVELELAVAHYHFDGNDRESGRAALERALALDATRPGVLVLAARVALEEKEWERASEMAEKAIGSEEHGENAVLYFLYANEALENVDEALDRILALDRLYLLDHQNILLALCEVQLSAGKREGYAATLSMYRKAYPSYYLLFKYLDARVLLMDGESVEAAQEFTIVIEGNPGFQRAKFYQAMAYLRASQENMRTGDLQRSEKERGIARVALEQYMFNVPNDEKALALWNSTFGAPKTYKTAKATAEALDRTGEADAQSLLVSAEALYAQSVRRGATTEDLDTVKRLLNRVIAMEPELPAGYLALTHVYLTEKNAVEARTMLQAALDAGVEQEKIRYMEASLALVEGDIDAARALLGGQLTRDDLADRELFQWVELFASRIDVAAAVDVLTLAGEGKPDDRRLELELQKIDVALRHREMSLAANLVDGLKDSFGHLPKSRERITRARLNAARALLAPGETYDLGKATSLIEEALAAERRNSDALVLRAQVALMHDPVELDDAEKYAVKARQYDAESADVYIMLAKVSSMRGHYFQALEYARQAKSFASQRPAILLAVAEAEMLAQEVDEARESLERVLDFEPDNAKALDMLVRLHARNREFRRAEASLAKLEVLAQDDEELAQSIVLLRGVLSANRGDFVKAEETLRGQLDADPDNMSTVLSLARALHGQGRRDDCEALLEGFAEAHLDDPEGWTALGVYHLAWKEDSALEEASSAFTQALLVAADYGPALRGMIEIQFRDSNPGAALGLIDRYLESQPNDVQVLFRKATLLSSNVNRTEQALEVIEHALGIEEVPEFFLLRGFLHLTLEHYRESVEDILRGADSQARRNAQLDAMLAEAYAGAGDLDLARHYLDSAKRKAGPGRSDAERRIGRVEALLEQEAPS